jgi:UDP-N-acetylglucosamine 2-epimerase (non-hydrolysing)
MALPIAHVVGARPNFMKLAPVARALTDLGLPQRVIHTGQHYSDALSDVFFRELELPHPDVNLEVGSGTHAAQTGAVMVALERHLAEKPASLLLLYGDVNSTLAGALVAAKIGLRFAHVEAGLRSFDRTMPEEINRLVADALADVLFTTSPEAEDNLVREGVPLERIHFVGNPMIDTLLRFRHRFDAAAMRDRLGLSDRYAVATIHRPSNVDSPTAARRVAAALVGASRHLPIVIPLHPRGREALTSAGLGESDSVQIVEPLGYLDFLSLVSGASVVITDSGGIQEETTILGIPCLTMRPNTERPITITHGTNRLVEPEDVVACVEAILASAPSGTNQAPPLWDGHAGERISQVVKKVAEAA